MRETALHRFQEAQSVGGRFLPFLTSRWPGSLPAAATYAPATVARADEVSVSVVIPCYNYARYLPDAVGSALSQRGVDVEVIIVNDQSTDRSGAIADDLNRRHPAVRVLHNSANVGHVTSFNRGWSESVGKYVVKLDADDLLAPDALVRATALLEAFPTVDLAYGHPRHFGSVHPPVGRTGDVTWRVWRGHDWLAERCRLGVSAITNPEMVIRSTFLRRFGAMNPAIPYAPDLELSLRVAARADIGYVAGADQALHREHPSSMSETDGSGTLLDLKARRDAFAAALDLVEEDELRARLSDSASRALAQDAVRCASATADDGCPLSSYQDLLTFARTAYPPVAQTKEFRRLHDADHPRRFSRVGAALGRLRRRLRQEGYYSRWMVSGV